MTWIILAAALGVISIVVVLLFRRIAAVDRREAELGEMVRQLTEHDVELYREFLCFRHRSNGSPPTGRAMADEGGPEPEAPPDPGAEPLRTKKHLRLLRGGLVAAALSAIAEFLREAYREHRGYVIGTAIGATAAGAATATLLVITPWVDGSDRRPSSSAPTATATLAQAPPAPPHPPQPDPTGSGPAHIPPPSPSALAPSPSASAVPSEFASPGPELPVPVVPIGEPPALPGLPAPTPSVAITSPGEVVEDGPSAPEVPSPAQAPPASPVDAGLCVGPVVDLELCPPWEADSRTISREEEQWQRSRRSCCAGGSPDTAP